MMRRPACLVLLLALALSACREDGDGTDFPGYAEGEYLRIAAPEGGWLQDVAVAKGQRIAAGAPLFVLESTRERAAVAEARAALAQAESLLADRRVGARPEEIAAIEAQLAEAEATLHLAEVTLVRQRELAQTAAGTLARLDEARAGERQAEARRDRIRADLATARLPARRDQVAAAEAAVQVAQSALAQAEWRLSQRAVSSPAAGIVDDVVRRVGEWAPGSGTIVSLLPDGATRVVFFVPEPRRATLRQGQTVAIECSACPPGLTARISRIATEAEYTPPVIYSRENRARLVWRVEAIVAPIPGAPTPGQPVTVRPAAP